ncbi:MAG: hypothetical protein M0Z52_07470 [Actinomycetota bacterium]|nr:hypothetical protein [Actinomycetota bacterium]
MLRDAGIPESEKGNIEAFLTGVAMGRIYEKELTPILISNPNKVVLFLETKKAEMKAAIPQDGVN